MKRYLRLYVIFFRMAFAKLTAYRGNFFGSVLTSLGWAVFSVISMALLSGRSERVFGWSRAELLVLTGVYSIVVGLFHVLFTRNFEQFSRIVHRGEFDAMLLKPVDTQFLISCTVVNIASVPRVIAAAGFTGYLTMILRNSLSIQDSLQVVIVSIAGLLFLYTVWFGILLITVWQSHLFNLFDLLVHVTDTAKYPSEMYSELRYLLPLIVLPVSLVTTLPAKALLGKSDAGAIWGFIVLTIIFLVVTRVLWFRVLRFYRSTGS